MVNVHKKLLLQAAACNLALLLRSYYGAGKPRAAHDRIIEAVFAILALMSLMSAVEGLSQQWSANSTSPRRQARRARTHRRLFRTPENRAV